MSSLGKKSGLHKKLIISWMIAQILCISVGLNIGIPNRTLNQEQKGFNDLLNLDRANYSSFSNQELTNTGISQENLIDSEVDLPKNPKSSYSENDSIIYEPLGTQYGFLLDLGLHSVAFADPPEYYFTILNDTFAANFSLYYRFVNGSSASQWLRFYVMDSAYRIDWGSNFQIWCNFTEVDHYITMEFTNNNSGIISYRTLYRDVQIPEYVVGRELSANGNVIPFDNNPLSFRDDPYFYISISDNLKHNQTIEVHYTMLNKDTSVKLTITHYPSEIKSTGIFQVNISNWRLANEGLNLIPIYVKDSAGNTGSTITFSYIKDTTAPKLYAPSPNNDWIHYCNQPVYELKKSFFGYYETEEIIIDEGVLFTFHFEDADISDLIIAIRYRKSLTELTMNISNNLNNQNLKPYQDIMDNLYSIQTLPSYQINETTWQIQIDWATWQSLENRECYLDLTVLDFAENSASYSLQFFIPPSTTMNIWKTRLIYIGSMILMVSSMIIYLMFQIVPHKRIQICPFADLSEDDSAILDVALQPMDLEKISRLERFIDRFIVKVDVERITPFDLDNFIQTPIQAIDEKELVKLLKNFKMDPYQQEEFIREMLMLPPSEREDFLREYMDSDMEAKTSEIDDDEDKNSKFDEFDLFEDE